MFYSSVGGWNSQDACYTDGNIEDRAEKRKGARQRDGGGRDADDGYVHYQTLGGYWICNRDTIGSYRYSPPSRDFSQARPPRRETEHVSSKERTYRRKDCRFD